MSGAAALALAAAAVLLRIAWSDSHRRAWALLAIAGGVGYFALRSAPQLMPGAQNLGEHWNWSGHLLALSGMVALAALLRRRAGLSAGDLGLAAPVHLGTATAVTAAALLASYGLNRASGGQLQDVPAETWLFLATMPGLVEEMAFRGVLLAAAERAAPATRRLAGVRVSTGALLLTLAFVAMHGVGLGTLISVLPAAMLYLWLRLATGSVLVPIVAHNLWNLSVLAGHL